jgi:hypothetical protein
MSLPAGIAERKYPPKNAVWTSDDRKSVRSKDLLEMRSQNVVQMDAQCPEKERLVTNANGVTYCRSVMGAEFVMNLC